MGIDLRDVDQPIGTLSGGERQCVAIARAVYFGAKVLILDEPTAALGVKQSGVVLKYIVNARERGLGVIFITHNPHHAYPVGDRFLLLKRGRSIGYYAKNEITRDELTALMAGGAELEELSHELQSRRRRRAEAAHELEEEVKELGITGPAPTGAERMTDAVGAGCCSAAAPTPGGSGSPTTRSRPPGSASSTSCPVSATSGWSSARTGTCRPIRPGSPTSWPAAGCRVAGGTMHGESGLHRAGDFPAIVAKTRKVAELTSAVERPAPRVRAGAGLPRRRDRRLPRAGASSTPTGGRRWSARPTSSAGSSPRSTALALQVHHHADAHVRDPGGDRAVPRRHRPAVRVAVPRHRAPTPTAAGDSVALIRDYPERIGYIHIKQMDPAIVDRAEREDLAFGQAVRAGRQLRAAAAACPTSRRSPRRWQSCGTETFVDRRAGHVPGRLRRARADRAGAPATTCAAWGSASDPPTRRRRRGVRAMTVRVGVIGVGMIGQDHIRRLTTVLSGAEVVAVSDVDLGSGRGGGRRAAGARVHATGQELIADDGGGRRPGRLVGRRRTRSTCWPRIAAGKPVFCEKPLATTQEACLRILDAEVARRPAAGAGRLHAPLRRGLPGAEGRRRQRRDRRAAADALHPPQPERARALRPDDMAITDTAVHEIDMVRWLFDEEIVGDQVLQAAAQPPRRRPARTRC